MKIVNVEQILAMKVQKIVSWEKKIRGHFNHMTYFLWMNESGDDSNEYTILWKLAVDVEEYI